jgi:cellulose synthase/poly-beta-1,6-N-acetylglucosamine synthase-like glycosyltransferase
MCLITVGMPVRNAMPWLPEAMDSLLRQTMADFEILVVVDGGSDGSLGYLRELLDARSDEGAKRGPCLRLLEQAGAGVTATLNRLLEEARTPWLVRQDADDVSYPQRMKKLVEAIRRYPEAGVIYSLADYHPRERCAGSFRCSRGTPDELRSIVESGFLLSICHSTVALNVEKARAVGGYRMDIHAEDADLWWRIARKFDMRCIPEALVGFRQNAQSVSARNLEKQQVAGLYVQYLLLSELWKLAPRPLAEVAGTLLEFLRPSRLVSKESLREFNMHLAERRMLRGLGSLARAAWASPGYFAGRLMDEFRHSTIANGVAPRLFLERKEALWS